MYSQVLFGTRDKGVLEWTNLNSFQKCFSWCVTYVQHFNCIKEVGEFFEPVQLIILDKLIGKLFEDSYEEVRFLL